MIRKGLYDIEVYCKKGFPFPEAAAYPICSWSYYDNYTDRHYTIILDPSHEECVQKGVIDSDTGRNNWDLYWVKTEKKLMILSFKLIRFFKPDVLSGWYSADFDNPYYFKRSENLEMKRMLDVISPTGYVNIKKKTISGMNVFDMIVGDKRIKKRTSYTLENVAIEENLPTKKKESHDDINIIYETDKLRFAEYNKGDVEVLEYLEKKLHIIDFYENTRTFAGLNDINEALQNSVIIDVVGLRHAHKAGFVLPSKRTFEEAQASEEDEDIGGALVIFPPPGIHKNVIVLDMAKFYPKILDLLNLSSETVMASGLTKAQCIPGEGFIYVEYEEGLYAKINMTKKGFLPSLYQEFLTERVAVEAEMKLYPIGSQEYTFLEQKRQVVKDTSNSLPGVNGFPKYRLFNPVIANAITWTGKKMIRWAKARLEELGYIVIYGDTDSTHVKLSDLLSPEEVVKLGHELSDLVSHDYIQVVKDEYNITTDSSFEIDFEKAFKSIIYIKKDNGEPAKKRYAAREFYEKGKYIDLLYVRGFDMRRSDAPQYTKALQEQVFRLLLWDHPKAEVIKYVKEMLKNFRVQSPSMIGVPKGINKPIGSYGKENKAGNISGIPAQIKGAIYANTYLGTNYDAGSKVKYIYLKKRKTSKIISAATLGKETAILIREEKQEESFLPTDIISFDNEKIIPDQFEIDYKKMIDIVIKKKIERVLAAAGIGWNEISGSKSLFDFEE